MKIAAIAIALFSFALFAIAETSAEQTDPVLIIRETYTVDNEGLKDDHGEWVDLSRFREVHLDGDNATVVASVNAPRLIGHPEGTTIRAVGKVKDGKMYYQKSARNAHIQNIIFDGNKRAWDAPRGVWIDGGQGTTISNCTFQNVSHSGLTVLGEHAQLVVRGCTFKNISWPEMVISSAQGVQAEFKISASTGTADEGWLKRPTNALMERWLTGRWTAQDVKQHGVRGYHRQLYPMDVGYLHGIYLTGKQHDVLIDNCSFENINWGFGINITGGSHSVIVSNCRFEQMGKGCLYIGDSDNITVTEFDAVDCAALLHLYRHSGKGSITFRNGKASGIGHFAFYVLDHNGNVNLHVMNNNIDGCVGAFIGCTGGNNYTIGGNRITNLHGDSVWEKMRNTRDDSHGEIDGVKFFENDISFKTQGASLFGPRSSDRAISMTGLGSSIRVSDNTFRNTIGHQWTYSRLSGPSPVNESNKIE